MFSAVSPHHLPEVIILIKVESKFFFFETASCVFVVGAGRGREKERKRKRESYADSILSTETDMGLDIMTLRS